MTMRTSVRLDGADANSLNTEIKQLEGRQQKLQDKLDQASDLNRSVISLYFFVIKNSRH